MSKGKYLAKTAGGTQPQNFGSNVVIGGGGTGQGGGPAGMTFGEAASVKDDKGISTIMSQQQAQDAQDAQQLSNYENQINQQFQDKLKKEKEEEERLKLLQELDAGIPKTKFGLNLPSFPSFPSFLTMGKAALEGFDSTNRFFKALAEKGVDDLSTKDKIILANLIGVGGLDTLNLQKYADKYDIDVAELGDRFSKAASGLEAGVKIGDETVSYEDLINNYLSGKPTGFGESLSTMYGDLKDLASDPLRKTPNLVREDGSYTLEGLKNVLGKEGIAYLKATDPKLYYSFTDPQTSGGIAELAQFDLSTLGNSPEDRRLAARVVAAREATSGQSGGGQGIVAAAPSQPIDIINPKLPGPIVPDPTQPKLPITPQTPFAPFDINAFYASLPQYTQQGIMNPNLMSYYQNLGLFPGMAV